MPNVSIKFAKTSEASILRDISIKAFIDSLEKYGHYPHGIESLKWHEEKISKEVCYKIQYDEQLVGGVYLSPQTNNEMKIDFLFINPGDQGKHIGSKVMLLVEENHDKTNRWFLQTPYKDYRNHRFYEKIGYQKFGEFKPDDNNEFKFFLYEKKK